MPTCPAVILFDVNETLSDMAPMASRFVDVGAPPHLAGLWFATLLRDGFALTAAGAKEKFAVLGEHALRAVLAEVALDRPLDDAVSHILAGFADLDVHPDVPDGVRNLHAAGSRLVTLTNGANAVAERLLTRAGVREEFELLLSVEDANRWKPAPQAYRYALEVCDVRAEDTLLVAAHPWDIDGAARAGLRTAWLARSAGDFPPVFTPPELTAASLAELAGLLPGR